MSKKPSTKKSDKTETGQAVEQRILVLHGPNLNLLGSREPGIYGRSVAWRDALAAVAIPFIEVHLSNVHARESFRGHSYFSDIAEGVISGLGSQGYELALAAALSRIRSF